MAWRVVVDTDAPDAPERTLADRRPLPARGPRLADPRGGPGAQRAARRAALGANHRRARRRGRPRGRMVGSRRQADRRLARDSKIALLAALGLAAASEADARESLKSVLDETRRAARPPSVAPALGRDAARAAARRDRRLRGADRARGRRASSNGGRPPATASGARSPTAGRSSSGPSPCRTCRSDATASSSTASIAR